MATVVETDSFMDATSFTFGGVLSAPFSIAPFNTAQDRLTVVLPVGAPKGTRRFDITLTGNFPQVTCTVILEVNPVFRIVEINGNQCAKAGIVLSKKYRITNQTEIQRTVNFTVTSTQTSSAPGNLDHFPVDLCGGTLLGNPLNPTPPTVSGSVTVPAGSGKFVDVCIDTQSYPACQEGSNCNLDIAATDVATGCVGRANSCYTVVLPGWQGCNRWKIR